jgi:hypothetical protein
MATYLNMLGSSRKDYVIWEKEDFRFVKLKKKSTYLAMTGTQWLFRRSTK